MDVSSIEILRNRDRFKDEMILYLLFMEEKTQKEAAEFMYQKNYSNINTSTIKNARQALMNSNLLESDGALRNANFKSQTDVIADKIRDSIQNSGIEFDDKDYEGLLMLLDSRWFRSFFSLEKIEGLSGVARNTNGTLEVSSGFTALEEVLVVFDDINQMAELGENKEYSEIAQYDTFESFMENEKGIDLSLEPKEIEEIFLEATGERGKELEWRKSFLKSIISEKEIFTSLPHVPTVIEHRNSDLLIGKDRLQKALSDS